jgi:CheY-like chemotaxis protein
MPLAVQERIFLRSFSTKSRQGRGLGTYSMKLLGEQYLGGKVSFISNEQSGTVFHFDVPLRLPEAGVAGDQRQHAGAEVLAHGAGLKLGSELRARFIPASPAASPRAPSAETADRIGRRRILVVEDNQDVRESFVDYLRSRFAYDVEFAEDGETGVAKAREWKPDLVFCDIGLPRLDGYEVARKLRDEPSLRGIVLVAMTGYGGQGDRARADRAGFDHHYTKPIDIDTLKRFLDTLPHAPDRSFNDFRISTAVTPARMLKDPGGTPTSNA